jgi:hypothetical protein
MAAAGKPVVDAGADASGGAAPWVGLGGAGVAVTPADGAGVGVAVTPSTDPDGAGDGDRVSPEAGFGVAEGLGFGVGVTVGTGVGVGDGPFSVDPGWKQRGLPQVNGYAARSRAGGTWAVVKGSGAELPGKVKPPSLF